MKTLQQLNFDNSYARLPNIFYSEHETEPLANSHLVHFNPHVAELIELDPAQVKRPDFIDIMTGRQPLPHFRETENPCLELLREVITSTARLIAKWMKS